MLKKCRILLIILIINYFEYKKTNAQPWFNTSKDKVTNFKNLYLFRLPRVVTHTVSRVV